MDERDMLTRRILLLKGLENQEDSHDLVQSPYLRTLIDDFEQYFENKFGLNKNTSKTSATIIKPSATRANATIIKPSATRTNATMIKPSATRTSATRTNATIIKSSATRTNATIIKSSAPTKSRRRKSSNNMQERKSSNNTEEYFKNQVNIHFSNRPEEDFTKTITYFFSNTQLDSETNTILKRLHLNQYPTVNASPIKSSSTTYSPAKIAKIKELWLRCTDLLKKTYEYTLQREEDLSNAIVVHSYPIQMKLEILELIPTIDENGKINNALKCKDNDSVKNHKLTCYPDHVLVELRDAFNIKYPEKAFYDILPERIIKLLHYYFGNNEDSFLDLIPNNKKKYLFRYFAAPLLGLPGNGSNPEQYVSLFLHYEIKYSHFAFINYSVIGNEKKIHFNDKYISEIETFTTYLENSRTIDKLFPDKVNKYDYFHTEFIIVLYFFLQQKHITYIGIYNGYEQHARGIYINKNKNGCIMFYDSQGYYFDYQETSMNTSLTTNVEHVMKMCFKKPTLYLNKQHQYNTSLCGVFVVTMLLYMLDPTKSTKQKLEHFMIVENRDEDMITNQTIQQNTNRFNIKYLANTYNRSISKKAISNIVYFDEIEIDNIYFIVDIIKNTCGYYVITCKDITMISFDGTSCYKDVCMIYKKRPNSKDTIMDKKQKENIVFIKNMEINQSYYFKREFYDTYYTLDSFSPDKNYGYMANKPEYNISEYDEIIKLPLRNFGVYNKLPEDKRNNFVEFKDIEQNGIYCVLFMKNNSEKKTFYTINSINTEEKTITMSNKTNQSITRSIDLCCFLHDNPIEIIVRKYSELMLLKLYYIYSNKMAIYGVFRLMSNNNNNGMLFRNIDDYTAYNNVNDEDINDILFDVGDIFIFNIMYVID
jgi:hypothetical protein